MSLTPVVNVTLDRSQRDALHSACMLDLSGVEEMELYLRKGEYEEARAITERVVGASSLLDDIGWDPQTPRKHFVLTAQADRLREVVQRLRGQAQDSLRDQARLITADPMVEPAALALGVANLRVARGSWQAEVQRSVDEDLDTCLVCDHILETLEQ